MKKILFAAALLATFSVQAQDARKGRRAPMSMEQRAERRTEMMKQKLNLTPDQAARIHELNLRDARERDARRADNADRRNQMRERHQEDLKDYEAVLTPQQMQQWRAMKQETIEMRHKKMDGNRRTQKFDRRRLENTPVQQPVYQQPVR